MATTTFRGWPINSMVLSDAYNIMDLFCWRCIRRCLTTSSGHVPLKETPVVSLDTLHMGSDVVIVKCGQRICGSGGALANAPIVQNKAYFEVKIQQTGVWCIGLGTRHSNLNKVPLGDDSNSWVLRQDGVVYNCGEAKQTIGETVAEGDILGLSYDHSELNLYLNGKALHSPVRGMRGTLYPALCVDDGAILDVFFQEFNHIPPAGYDKIMFEQSLL